MTIPVDQQVDNDETEEPSLAEPSSQDDDTPLVDTTPNLGAPLPSSPLPSATMNPDESPLADDDDDDMTIIGLEYDPENTASQETAAMTAQWVEQNGPEMEERRRQVLLRELQRVQRASFIHFMLLCLIPTALLLVVVFAVIGDEEDCESDVANCVKEPRTFINAFTTRCICDAIDVAEE